MRKRKVLLLNADYRPHKLISWQHAIQLLSKDKVTVVEEYDDWEVSSPSTTLKVPSVLVLDEYVNHQYSLNYSRENVLSRDNYTCQYCGRSSTDGELERDELTIDHVYPQSRGGKTRWDNVVASCEECNLRKGDRTPDQAGMQLNTDPDYPHGENPVKFWIRGRRIEESWKPYCTWLED